MLKEVVMACFKVLFQCLLGKTEENHKIVRVSVLLAQVLTRDLPNTNQGW
jgi:hypothetical protein